MRPLPDFALEVYFSQWEFKARHHLCASDAQTLALRELLALATAEEREAFEALPLGYVETWGTPRLRAAIAATYRLAPEDVLCFAGAEEGLYCALHALLGRGGHAVVTVPNYQSMESVALALGEATGVVLRPEDGWALDLDAVRRALRPDTKVVAVNFPNNPTGAMPDEATWRGLVALCAEAGVHLLSDEVYRGLEQPPRQPLPQAAELYEKGLSLGVLSKAYGLPGLRVGWVASRDRALLARLEKLRHYLSICNAGPSELLASVALRSRETLLARNRALVRDNTARARTFFAARPALYAFDAPQGGCVAFPRYLGRDGVEEHCRRLVEEAGVLLLPASRFGSALGPVPQDRFRVGLGRAGLDAGLGAWRQWLAAQRDA